MIYAIKNLSLAKVRNGEARKRRADHWSLCYWSPRYL